MGKPDEDFTSDKAVILVDAAFRTAEAALSYKQWKEAFERGEEWSLEVYSETMQSGLKPDPLVDMERAIEAYERARGQLKVPVYNTTRAHAEVKSAMEIELPATVPTTTPNAVIVYDPEADEVLESYQEPERIDRTHSEKWLYRSRRNVFFLEDGRRILIWRKGASISNEEAQRQGVPFYMEPCATCEGLGNHTRFGERRTCEACNGKGQLRRAAPWTSQQ